MNPSAPIPNNEYPAQPQKVAPESLEMRARPQRVTRLNPWTLAVVSGGLATVVLGAMLWSLQPQQRRQGVEPNELYNIDRITRSEGLNQLPSDYTQLPPAPIRDTPRPAPPDEPDSALLPLDQQGRAADYPLAGSNSAALEQQTKLKEAEEAALSPVFFRSTGGGQHAVGHAGLGAKTADHPSAVTERNDHRGTFPGKSVNTEVRTSGFVQMPESPYQVMAGTVIAAALVTGIQSDLPGDVIATVTEPVYDSATGEHLLIAQGSRLLGRYDSQVSYGQRRVQVVWQRIILPDTSSFQLDDLVGTDAAGYAGLEDGVDWHWDRIVAGAAMTTLLGIGAELAAPSTRGEGDRVIIAGRDSVQDTVNQVGQEMTRRNLDIKPTLIQRPGLPLRVIVNRDLVLRPLLPTPHEWAGQRNDATVSNVTLP